MLREVDRRSFVCALWCTKQISSDLDALEDSAPAMRGHGEYNVTTDVENVQPRLF